MLLIAVAPKLVPSRQASRWHAEPRPRLAGVAGEEQLEGDEADRCQQRGDERPPVTVAADGEEGGDGAGGDEGDAVGSGRRRQGGGDAGQQPALVEQEPQAQPRRARSAAPRRRRRRARTSRGTRRTAPSPARRRRCRTAAGRARRRGCTATRARAEVDDERGERVAAGKDAVEGAHEQRVEREERGACLELEVGDVRRDRARVAVADDLQVPQAVPLRQHAGDQPERGSPAWARGLRRRRR